ncbi:hypothetical protein [Aquisalimonas sp.]|uniref:hypothetical protein n=1 Tax=Aquisalimonas sp. TaxID=1872621 RepID=UPI0025C58A5B|nr:hypothetical protein [Aquisalimonas sp.]
MKLSSWLAICTLLISSLALGMGTAIADKDEKDENRVEEGTGGAQHADPEGEGAVDEDDDWDDREDEWDDEDDEEMDR